MSSHIVLLDDNNKAITLSEKKYHDEDLFQRLIAEHPEILAGEQITPDDPRRWILIKREMGVATHAGGNDWYSLDHLFVDQDAIPTLVEVKRSSDTRLRREVVAQMMDYAANAIFWPEGKLRELYEEQFNGADIAPAPFGLNAEQVEMFWAQVDANLKAGKLRLIFVADEIPDGLRRVIEFLNEKMPDIEVLALEIKQYLSEQNHRILVPKIIGQTTAAVELKKKSNETWNRDTFLKRVEAYSGKESAGICLKVIQNLDALDVDILWGRGAVQAGFVASYHGRSLAAAYSYKKQTKIEFMFGEYKPPLHSSAVKQELARYFNAIAGTEIGPESFSLRPSFDCLLLNESNRFDAFTQAISYMQDVILSAEAEA